MRPTPTHVYCESCNKIQPAKIDRGYRRLSWDGNFLGRDICCGECLLIVAAIYIPKPEGRQGDD